MKFRVTNSLPPQLIIARTNLSDLKLPSTDFKHLILKYIINKWQSEWDKEQPNILHKIKPILGESTFCLHSYREEIVLTCSYIGHPHITHTYLLNRENCLQLTCNTSLIKKHILQCSEFDNVCVQHFHVTSMNDLFILVPGNTVTQFQRHSNVFHHI